jgi:hypothetical protein
VAGASTTSQIGFHETDQARERGRGNRVRRPTESSAGQFEAHCAAPAGSSSIADGRWMQVGCWLSQRQATAGNGGAESPLRSGGGTLQRIADPPRHPVGPRRSTRQIAQPVGESLNRSSVRGRSAATADTRRVGIDFPDAK